ncbi:MAG TPA: CPBP family intramembrane glutamic endopeptidase [Candidatus Solibacter sp.]|nr:CPBP family intramembrane glutamic endopeptidase [Candidatus Solibacter sp.]
MFLLFLYPLAFLAVSFLGPLLLLGRQPDDVPGVADASDEPRNRRANVELPAVHYGVLIGGVTLWMWANPHEWNLSTNTQGGAVGGILLGGLVGMAWCGIWFQLVGTVGAPPGLRRLIPALGATSASQLTVTLLGACAEELWRVIALTSFNHSGYSNEAAVILTAVAFGVVWIGQSLPRGVLSILEGALLALLFVWQGSILAPFTAHLAIQGVFMAAGGRRGRRQRFGTGAKGQPGSCPACGHALSRLEVSLREGFPCPACGAPLSVSESYRTTRRWVVGALTLVYIVLGYGLLLDKLAFVYVYFIALLLAIGAQISTMVLIQSLFMPKLQYGDPNFLALHLEAGRQPPSQHDGK